MEKSRKDCFNEKLNKDFWPLITVITLSYNSEFILDSIQSVLEQNYPKIEYIIVDDGSMIFDIEGIDAYIREHKKDNILNYKIIINPQNLGTVKASNVAVKSSSGQYLFNLAADDIYYDSDILEKWVKEFQKRDALIMTGLSAVYDETLTKFQKLLPDKKDVELLAKQEPQRLFERLCYSNIVYGCCTARSRKCIEQYGLYDENYRLIEDYPAALYLSRKGVVIECWEQPVIKYRQGGVSSSGNFSPAYSRDSDLIVQKEIIPYVRNPWMIRLYYWRWKNKRKDTAQFSQQLEKIEKDKRKYLIPFLFIRFPFPALRYMKRRLLCKY